MSCSLIFILTVFVSAHVGSAIYAAPIAALFCVLLLFGGKADRWQALFLAVCFICAALISSYTFTHRANVLRRYIGEERELTVTVTEVKSQLSYMNEFYVKADGTGALLTCSYPLAAEVGDRVSGTFTVEDFEENINGYPEKSYQFSRGNTVHLYSEEDGLSVCDSEKSIHTFFYKARGTLNARMQSLLTEESASYLSCLLLGERDGLPADFKNDFTHLGLSHLLAISGMHLGILTGAFLFILKLLRLHKGVRYVLTVAAIFLFAALTGFPSSLTRAALATSVVLSCFFIGKRADSPSALCFAVALIYAFDPFSAFDIGLTLSFAATLGIVTVAPLMQRQIADRQLHRYLKKLLNGLFVTAVALTFTLPFTLIYFGTYSFVSIFSTLLFSPFVCGALYIAPLITALGTVPLIGNGLCAAAELLTQFTFDLAALLSDSLRYTVSVEYPFGWVIITLYCAVLLILLVCSARRWWLYLIPICLLTVSIYPSVAIYNKVNEDEVTLSACTSGRNDLLCISRGGSTTVIDISNATAAPSSLALYTAKTEHYSIYVENYVIFNRSARSNAFINRLLSANRIDNLYLPASLFSEKELEELSETASGRGTDLKTFMFGDALSLSGVTVDTDAPVTIDRSVVPCHRILIESGGESALYLGAAYSETRAVKTADYVICGGYGPLYKEEFSFEGEVYICESAADYYIGDATVYEKVTNVILNND